MKVNSSRFGEMDFSEEHVFTFSEGLLGFPNAKGWVIINHPGTGIFKWLQSLDDPELAFVIAEPFAFFPDYGFNLDDNDVKVLGISDPTKILVYCILVIPKELHKITANLKAPIVVSGETRKAKQVVLMDEMYSTKHYINAK